MTNASQFEEQDRAHAPDPYLRLAGQALRRFRHTLIGLFAVAASGAVPGLVTAEEPPETAGVGSEGRNVFRNFSERVVKIQVVENRSGAKAVIGSAFFVTPDGDLVTNYHVVSKLVHHPERYHAEFIDREQRTHPVQVVNVDVIHDLAVVHAKFTPPSYFRLQHLNLDQGERLYALGFPLDLGITIAEGTYNGLLQHALYPKIHFTGALNPGMSGGPTLAGNGLVAGINVSTAGNEVSFLVPVDDALRLLDETLQPDYQPPEDFLQTVRGQLLAHQQRYLGSDLIRDSETVQLGGYTVPTRPAPFFNCWADSHKNEDKPYEIIVHQCSTEDYLFISGDQISGTISFRHRLLTGGELNTFRFHHFYSRQFQSVSAGLWGDEEEVTRFTCDTDNVRNGDTPFKAVFCARAYRKMEGLYDMVLKAASLNQARAGLSTELVLFGVSYDKAMEIARSYLESIRWNPQD